MSANQNVINQTEVLQVANAEIKPCEVIPNIENKRNYQRLNLDSSQRIQMNGLLQHIPQLAETGMMQKAYVVRFPKGLPKDCHLMNYIKGGQGTAIQTKNGTIVAHASLHELTAQAAVAQTFNVMAIASGQYFLSQINSEMKTMNQSIDKILEFLYGDKRAELIAEVSFVKSAYNNYGAIMQYDQQRLATLVSLQEAKKVAMKDIEFYIADLDSTLTNKLEDVYSMVEKAFQIKECLELSTQLYSMSSAMEIYYAQNYDSDYLANIENEAILYISKCEKRILSSFSKLVAHIRAFKQSPFKQIDKTMLEGKVNEVIEAFSKGTESNILQAVKTVLQATTQDTEYYVGEEGDLYLKKSIQREKTI